MSDKKILVFVEEGIGNIIQAIPSIIAMHRAGYVVDLAVRSNYPGYKEILQIPEVNHVYNMYIERVSEPKSYKKIVLTMFGHLNHYKHWKEDFDGVEVMHDLELAKDIGRINDVEVNMRFAKALGYKGDTPDVKLNLLKNDSFETFDNIICAGSGALNKRWSYFGELAKRLTGRVGIIGGPKEEKVNWPPNCVDMSGILDLQEIATIISKAGVYLGNDSGISHLANATGCPCVITWGPTNLIKCRPWNQPVAIVSKNYPCQPCMLIQTDTKCQKEGKVNECLRDLTIDEVFKAVEKLKTLSGYRNEKDYMMFWNNNSSLPLSCAEEIKTNLKEILETSNLSEEQTESILDFGCGKGELIPVLNHYYKKITGVDIIKQKLDELSGVEFTLLDSPFASKIESKHKGLLLSNVLSYMTYKNMLANNLENIKGCFEHCIVIDRIKGIDEKEITGKQTHVDLEIVNKLLGIQLEEKITIHAESGEAYSILTYGI